MKKSTKIVSSLSLVLLMGLGFAGCATNASVLYSNKFIDGNNATFNTTGYVITDNTDQTITINKSTIEANGSSTYFGETDKNFDWVDGGVSVTITMKLDPVAIPTDKGFTWAFGLNNKIKNAENKFVEIGECYLHFRKYAEGIKIAVGDRNSDDIYNKNMTKDSTSIITTAGTYAMTFKFYPKNATENNILVDQKVVNTATNATVLSNVGLIILDVPGVAIPQTSVAGLRFAWLSFMSVDSLIIDDMEITKNA
ncbi:MAG: hypothetical protein RR247_02570 [Clostridia bacterium]